LLTQSCFGALGFGIFRLTIDTQIREPLSQIRGNGVNLRIESHRQNPTKIGREYRVQLWRLIGPGSLEDGQPIQTTRESERDADLKYYVLPRMPSSIAPWIIGRAQRQESSATIHFGEQPLRDFHLEIDCRDSFHLKAKIMLQERGELFSGPIAFPSLPYIKNTLRLSTISPRRESSR